MNDFGNWARPVAQEVDTPNDKLATHLREMAPDALRQAYDDLVLEVAALDRIVGDDVREAGRRMLAERKAAIEQAAQARGLTLAAPPSPDAIDIPSPSGETARGIGTIAAVPPVEAAGLLSANDQAVMEALRDRMSDAGAEIGLADGDRFTPEAPVPETLISIGDGDAIGPEASVPFGPQDFVNRLGGLPAAAVLARRLTSMGVQMPLGDAKWVFGDQPPTRPEVARLEADLGLAADKGQHLSKELQDMVSGVEGKLGVPPVVVLRKPAGTRVVQQAGMVGTTKSSPEAARFLIGMAVAKGWKSVRIACDDPAIADMMWIEAQRAGMPVKGYSPSPAIRRKWEAEVFEKSTAFYREHHGQATDTLAKAQSALNALLPQVQNRAAMAPRNADLLDRSIASARADVDAAQKRMSGLCPPDAMDDLANAIWTIMPLVHRHEEAMKNPDADTGKTLADLRATLGTIDIDRVAAADPEFGGYLRQIDDYVAAQDKEVKRPEPDGLDIGPS